MGPEYMPSLLGVRTLFPLRMYEAAAESELLVPETITLAGPAALLLLPERMTAKSPEQVFPSPPTTTVALAFVYPKYHAAVEPENVATPRH
jgi:hypothetical protein